MLFIAGGGRVPYILTSGPAAQQLVSDVCSSCEGNQSPLIAPLPRLIHRPGQPCSRSGPRSLLVARAKGKTRHQQHQQHQQHHPHHPHHPHLFALPWHLEAGKLGIAASSQPDGAMIPMQRSLSLPGPAHASPRTCRTWVEIAIPVPLSPSFLTADIIC